jgi:opacity protein-like surface antigen
MKLFLAATCAALMIGSAASAAVVTYTDNTLPIDGFATGITYVDAAQRGLANNRNDPANALGATNGTFFEVGYGSTIDLTFGALFRPNGSTVEITNGSRGATTPFYETITILFGIGGVFTQVAMLDNAGPSGPLTLFFSLPGGPSYDTVRFVDTTVGRPQTTGGWDVDSVKVALVPLPAAGFLLLAGLAGLAAMRRRQSTIAA